VKAKAALHAEEVIVQPAAVAVVAADNLAAVLAAPHANRGQAAVTAVGAHGAHVIHLPGPRLIAIAAAGQRSHGTDVNALAALLAVQLIAHVGCDHRTLSAVLDAEGVHVHSFSA